jgi:hypothetical protein
MALVALASPRSLPLGILRLLMVWRFQPSLKHFRASPAGATTLDIRKVGDALFLSVLCTPGRRGCLGPEFDEDRSRLLHAPSSTGSSD